MACYHPLKAFVIGINENGKKDLKICPYDTECLFLPFGSDVWEKHGYVLDPSIVHGRVVTEFIPIPCGQCIGCRLEHSRQWAVRCMLESQYHDENYFVTLTYNDESLPINEYVSDDGEILESMTLLKKDVQDFFKRLRSHFDYNDSDGFRYFYCGEYGSKTARPHYHVIFFGLHLDDLILYKETPLGNYYTSEFLTSKWGHGHVIIGGVSFESCAYVSRYIMKKQKGEGAKIYDQFNILPEYISMSRRPGIARKYFDENYIDIYSSDCVVLPGGDLVNPPRYFDMLMDDIDEELMSDIKLSRRDVAESIQLFKQHLSTADYQMQLHHAENNKACQLKRLVRTLE